VVDEVNNEAEHVENTEDVESTGNRNLDKRLETGVLQGDKGTETAQVWISAFLIAALGFLVYLGSFSIPLHGGDLKLLHDSTALHRIVTSPGAVELMPASPLSTLGLAVSCAVIGGRVDGIHGASIFFHLCCAVLVFLIARRLLPRGTPEVVAMLAGMVFAAHPAMTEAVNYLNAFPVLQSTFFGLLALLLLLRGSDRPDFNPVLLAGAVACFVLAFGSDTSTLLLPLLGIGLLQLTPAGPDFASKYRRVAVPALAVTMAALWVAGRAAGVLDTPVITIAPIDRLSAFVGLCGKVLVSALWPFHQTILPAPGGLVTGGIALVAGIAAVLAGFKGRTLPGQVGLWVLVSAFGIACYGPADLIATTRYVYLPIAGLAMLLPWGMQQIKNPAINRGAGIVAAAAILVLGFLSFQRTDLWKSPAALWAQEAERHPDALTPWIEQGRFLWAQSRVVAETTNEPELLKQAYSDAAMPWRNVLDRDPDHREAQKRLGMIQLELGQVDEALDLLSKVVVYEPEDQQLVLYLALANEQQARKTADREVIASALRGFRQASRLGALPPEAKASYGMLSAGMGDYETGVQLLQTVVGDTADHPLAAPLKQFQSVLEQVRSLDQRADTAAKEHPESPESIALRAERLLVEGRTMSAFYLLQLALDQAPAQDGVWALLGYVSARMSSGDQFLAERGESRASNAAAWGQLAVRTASGGLWEAAEAYLRYGLTRVGGTDLPEVKLAGIAVQLRQIPKATAYLEAAQQAYPDRPEPWLGLADIAITAGESTRAVTLLDGAEARGAAAELVKPLRDKLGGEKAPSSTGIQRTIIR